MNLKEKSNFNFSFVKLSHNTLLIITPLNYRAMLVYIGKIIKLQFIPNIAPEQNLTVNQPQSLPFQILQGTRLRV